MMANEKRLIDANALTDSLEKWLSDAEVLCNAHVYNAIEDCLCEVDTMPTVDAVEVVHGKWEVVHGVMTPGGDPLLRCSICKSRESEHLCGIECRTVWSYCPNCGAKMDGDGNG